MVKRILLGTPKGGVGKTTTSIVLSERCLFHKIPTVLKDSAGNPSVGRWKKKCMELGRPMSDFTHKSPDVEIIDTRGAEGSALPYIDKADFIIIPLKLKPADFEDAEEFFESLDDSDRVKCIFIGNMYKPSGLTKQQHAVKEAVEELIRDYDAGFYLDGLPERDATSNIENGISKNLFELEVEHRLFRKVQKDAAILGDTILKAFEII